MQGSRYSRFSAVSPNARPQSAKLNSTFKNKQKYTFGGRTPNSQKKLRRLINDGASETQQQYEEPIHTFEATPERVRPQNPGTPEFKEHRPYVARSVMLQNTAKLERPRSSVKPGAGEGLSRKFERFNEDLGMSAKGSSGTRSLRNIKTPKEGQRKPVAGAARKGLDAETLSNYLSLIHI